MKGAGDRRGNWGYHRGRVGATHRGVTAVLHYLDVMIGFAFTMLVISLAVTALVQAVPVYMRNLKGASLERGLTDLFVRLLPGLEAHAGVIVGQILRDPLLSAPRTGLSTWVLKRLSHAAADLRPRSGVVSREELVRLLLDFMAQDDQPGEPEPVKAARAKLKALLAKEGLTDPAGLLQTIRTQVAVMEQQHPDWSSSQRASKAMLDILLAGPGKDFMAKLVGWFDQTMDRVEAAYVARVRIWTTLFSVALVLALHLDSFDLLARLNADNGLRDKLVTAALAAEAQGQPAGASESRALACAQAHLVPAGAAARPADPKAPAPRLGLDAYADCMGLADATRLEIVSWPDSAATWAARWAPLGLGLLLQLVGLALSVSLLTLGAPFWYEMLSNLIKLRSTISAKDTAARKERQQAQAG